MGRGGGCVRAPVALDGLAVAGAQPGEGVANAMAVTRRGGTALADNAAVQPGPPELAGARPRAARKSNNKKRTLNKKGGNMDGSIARVYVRWWCVCVCSGRNLGWRTGGWGYT